MKTTESQAQKKSNSSSKREEVPCDIDDEEPQEDLWCALPTWDWDQLQGKVPN